MIGEISVPYKPTDISTDVTNGNIRTNKLYVAEGNDINKNQHYFDSDDVVFVDVQKYVTEVNSVLTIDNHSNPNLILFNSTGLQVELNQKVNYVLNYIPFSIFYIDSIVEYKTKNDFRVELIYNGRLVESVQVHFDRITDKSYTLALTWFDSLSTDEKKELNVNRDDKDGVLALWIDRTFLSSLSKSLPNKDYCKTLIKNEKFSFNYTNDDYYTDFQDKEW
jgi:hypothetical protein